MQHIDFVLLIMGIGVVTIGYNIFLSKFISNYILHVIQITVEQFVQTISNIWRLPSNFHRSKKMRHVFYCCAVLVVLILKHCKETILSVSPLIWFKIIKNWCISKRFFNSFMHVGYKLANYYSEN